MENLSKIFYQIREKNNLFMLNFYYLGIRKNFSGGNLVFESEILNNSVFVKNYYNKTIEKNDKIKKVIKHNTKIYFSKNNIKNKSSLLRLVPNKTVSYIKNFGEDVVELSLEKNTDFFSKNDKIIVDIIGKMPCLDNYIFNETLKSSNIFTHQKYNIFEIDEYKKIKLFLAGNIFPVMHADYGVKQLSDDKLLRSHDLIFSQSSPNESFVNFFKILNVQDEKVKNILLSWKSIIYLDYVYAEYKQKIKNFINWINEIDSTNRNITYKIRVNRDISRQYFFDYIKKIDGLFIIYKEAYKKIFFDKKDVAPFVSFIHNCENYFYDIACLMAKIDIALKTWDEFCQHPESHQKDIDYLSQLFHDLTQNMD
jgi:hypothetical protein